MKKELYKLCVSAVVAAVCLTGFSTASGAATYTFSTSDSLFDFSTYNQGWWSDTLDRRDNNDNVHTGHSITPYNVRAFFTFDLKSLDLAPRENIVSATFSGFTHKIYVSGGPSETIGLFDVSTDAATLNNSLGRSSAIFDDLGTGAQYGSFEFDESDEDSNFKIGLNSALFDDATAAQGGFFSIGTRLLTLDSDGSQSIFAYSGRTPYTLTLETSISAVPLPAALPLYGAGIAILGFMGWRRKKAHR